MSYSPNLSNLNPKNAQFAGRWLEEPLCQVKGDVQYLNLSKLKRKLIIGENSTGCSSILREISWPQQCNPRNLVRTIPKHSELSPLHLFCGMVNKCLSKAPPSLSNFTTQKQLRHTPNLASMVLSIPWADVLDHNASLFRNIEQAQLDWDSWEKIALWYLSSLKSLRMNSQLQPPNKKLRSDLPDTAHNPSKNGRKTIEGLVIIWMRDNQCFL